MTLLSSAKINEKEREKDKETKGKKKKPNFNMIFLKFLQKEGREWSGWEHTEVNNDIVKSNTKNKINEKKEKKKKDKDWILKKKIKDQRERGGGSGWEHTELSQRLTMTLLRPAPKTSTVEFG